MSYSICIGGSADGQWHAMINERERLSIPDGKGSFHWEYYNAMRIKNRQITWIVYVHEDIDDVSALSKIINGYKRPRTSLLEKDNADLANMLKVAQLGRETWRAYAFKLEQELHSLRDIVDQASKASMENSQTKN